jgi:hypothetical protein
MKVHAYWISKISTLERQVNENAPDERINATGAG